MTAGSAAPAGTVATSGRFPYNLRFTALTGREVVPRAPPACWRTVRERAPMLEGIQRGLSEALKKLRGRGRLTEANVREGLQEVRRALLDADVNYTVANDFIARVTERSIGQQVLRTVDPSEQIVKIVYDELVQQIGRAHV